MKTVLVVGNNMAALVPVGASLRAAGWEPKFLTPDPQMAAIEAIGWFCKHNADACVLIDLHDSAALTSEIIVQAFPQVVCIDVSGDGKGAQVDEFLTRVPLGFTNWVEVLQSSFIPVEVAA